MFGQEADSSNQFLRLNLYQAEKPDYYYKDILVAPRRESLLKVCAEPFERPVDEEEKIIPNFEQSVFRDWVIEDQGVCRDLNEEI